MPPSYARPSAVKHPTLPPPGLADFPAQPESGLYLFGDGPLRPPVSAGGRRAAAGAVVQAGWADVPVTVVEADNRQMAELAIVENLQRKDLSPLEKAASFERYLDQYGCTQEELAGRLKIDRSTIANLIRLLELPPAVQDAIRRKQISPGHARALLPLGDEGEQIDFCRRIQQEGLNVRQTESMVQELIDRADADALTDGPAAEPSKPARHSRGKNDQVAALEQELRRGPWAARIVEPQCPRPRPAGDPIPQPRRVRAAEKGNLRRVKDRGRATFPGKAGHSEPGEESWRNR